MKEKTRQWLILTIVSTGLFLVVMDSTILYTALPTLTHDLQANASEKLWIVNVYPLVVACLLPAAGTASDFYGNKKMFLLGITTFGIASLLAAFSMTPSMLIISRVILGVGAAMMMPATLSIIRTTFADKKERTLALSIWASIASGGAALGPIIGGLTLQFFWWGAAFLINVPIVIIAIISGSYLIYKHQTNKESKWDALGSIQIMIALFSIMFFIKELAKRDNNPILMTLILLVGIVFLVLFIKRMKTNKNPLIDFSLFKDIKFSSGVIAALLSSAALVAIDMFLVQRLQLVLGYSPINAGMFILLVAVSSFVGATIVNYLISKFNIIKIQAFSLLTCALGIILYLLFKNDVTFFQILSLIIFGFGIGTTMSSASIAIMVNAPYEKAGMASSIEEVSYELGGALGVGILGSISSFIYTKFMIIPNYIQVPPQVKDSLDEALLLSEKLTDQNKEQIINLAKNAFEQSFNIVILISFTIFIIAGLSILYINKRVNR